MQENDLLKYLTELLMDNKCTVNKLAMVKLVKFIVRREKSIFEEQIREAQEQINRLNMVINRYEEK